MSCNVESKIIVNEKLDRMEQFPVSFTASNEYLAMISQLGRFILCKQIDLSSNAFINSSFAKYFLSVEELNLDGNELENLDGLRDLKHLERLSVCNNRLGFESFAAIKGLELKQLKLTGNLLQADQESLILSWFHLQ